MSQSVCRLLYTSCSPVGRVWLICEACRRAQSQLYGGKCWECRTGGQR